DGQEPRTRYPGRIGEAPAGACPSHRRSAQGDSGPHPAGAGVRGHLRELRVRRRQGRAGASGAQDQRDPT
ncbi:MAG: Transcription elongation factor GreA, partial [uncultured Rubrobacteraceae bacterium]